MNFSFGQKLGSTTASNSFAPLAPNKIHNVTFQGITYGVSQNGQFEFFKAKYNAISPEIGSHTISLFPPKSKERKSTAFGVNPSEEETFMLIVLHILQGLDDDLAMKVATEQIVPKLNPSNPFKSLVEWLAEITTPFIGKQHQLKLLKDYKGATNIPGFPTRVNPETDLAEIKVNFIGPVLVFTNYELKKIQESEAAVPSAAPAINLDTTPTSILDSTPTTVPTPNTQASSGIDLNWD